MDDAQEDLKPFEDYFPMSVYDGYPPEWLEMALLVDRCCRSLEDTRTPFLDMIRRRTNEHADPAPVDPADEH